MTVSTATTHGGPAPKRPWIKPEITDLPRLENLTLQTGAPVGGSQSVFP